MITMVIPTRNRAHTLRLVAPSYFEQECVTEIIFVSDAGDDDTPEVIASIASSYPRVSARVLRNEERKGASHSRNVGVEQSSNEFILFCDDDEYLEPGYARICLEKLQRSNAGAVSGRRVYMEKGETPEQAVRRFGNGLRNTAPFRHLICEYVNAARFSGDIVLPITNAIILTRKNLLQRFPYDSHYARGNGYREETDYQMNLFVHGYSVIVTNECHSVHLPMSLVRTGGQRTQPTKRVYWSVYYTHYFYKKYYNRYAEKVGLKAPRWLAVTAFAVFAVYRETLRPPLYKVAKWALHHRSRLRTRPSPV